MGADASCMDVHRLPSHVPFHTTQGETHAEARGEFSCVLPLSRDQKISSFPSTSPSPTLRLYSVLYVVLCMHLLHTLHDAKSSKRQKEEAVAQ